MHHQRFVPSSLRGSALLRKFDRNPFVRWFSKMSMYRANFDECHENK